MPAFGFDAGPLESQGLLLPFEWGEYAIWHLWPACRVSVDGRFRTVYPEEILEAHYAAHVDTARWPALAEDLDVVGPDV